MGIKQQDIDRAIAEGNKVLQQLRQTCPIAQESKPMPAKRIRQSTKPLSNPLETEFGQYLQANYPNASTKFYEQAITLRLGNGLKYTPDWVVCISLRTYCFEVKGKHVWDDSIAKLKMAATVYPKWGWYLVWKQDGQWSMQKVLP